MDHDDFVKLLEERGDVVYILDRGLVRFGKFATAVLAIFALVGVFFFGLDIKKATEDLADQKQKLEAAKDELKKADSDLADAKQKTIDATAALDKSRADYEKLVSDAKTEMDKDVASARDAIATIGRAYSIEQQFEACTTRSNQAQSLRDCMSIATTTTVNVQSAEVGPTKANVAVVSEIKELKDDVLSRVVAALQKQVSRDLQPIWNVDATLKIFKTLGDVPKGYWPLLIKNDVGTPGAAGMHEIDKDGTPFGLVTYSKTPDEWTLTASWELIDMLVDPQGNRVISAPSPNPADRGKPVNILVEVAQPLGGKDTAYPIDGVLVADFARPDFYGATTGAQAQYDFAGHARAALKIMKNGYLSWANPDTHEWFQQIWFDGDAPEIRSLGKIDSQ